MKRNDAKTVRPGLLSFAGAIKSNTLTSIVTDASGVAVTTVAHTHRGQPILRACEFTPAAVDLDTDLEPLLKVHGLNKQRCTTLMPHGEYQLLLVEAPEVPPAELRSAIRWRIQNLIKFRIEDAVLDVFDAQSNRTSAQQQQQLHVVVAQSSTVRKHINQLEQAGARLDTIDIPELALRNIAATLPEDKNGVVTLHFEQEYCLITLTHNTDLYLTRTLDIGYRKLKESAANPQALINRLALEIQRSMDYYEHNFHQPHITSMVMLPVREQLYGFTDALQQALGIDARVLAMSDIVQCDVEPDEETTAHCMLAVGSALRAEEKTL